VLKDYATSPNAITQGNSIVASICPRDLTSSNTSPGYGYNPAVAALINRLKEKLKGSCLPRPLSVDADGQTLCRIVEAVPPSVLESKGQDCPTYCPANGREYINPNDAADVNSAMAKAVLQQMSQGKNCDTAGGVPCSSMCTCLLEQETGSNLTTCQNDPDGPTVTGLPPGYCYIDPDNGIGTNPDLVAKCPASQRRILRFAGNGGLVNGNTVAVPLANAFVFTACQGSAISASPAVDTSTATQ